MSSTSLGGWFDKVFFDAHGEPCASGELRFYQTGTDIPQGVATFDGTPLGAVVRLDDDGRPESDFRFYTDKIYRVVVVDADGVVVKQIDGVAIPEGEGGAMYNPMTAAGDLIVGGTDGEADRLAPGNDGEVLKVVSGVPAWATDAEGMQNPMTDPGDLIVGTTGGEPDRLGVGADGDILGSWSFGGNVLPKWEAGTKKYRNVYGDIPSSQIDDGYLGCLFYLSASGQTLDLPSSATIPSKSFIDFVCLNDTATLTITPQGTTTLNEQAAAVTIGGKSATLYRLTFLGHGGSGDEWALGGSVLPDGKVKVDGSDTSPDYLAAKLAAGSGISLTNTGSAVEIAATAQSGDHQLLVSATDAAAGYLGAKLTAGSNITITPQTDGDGVQTLEISSTGGGGGGGGEYSWSVSPVQSQYYPDCNGYCYGYFVGGAQLPSVVKSFTVFARSNPYSKSNFTCWVAIYDWTDTANNRPLKSSFTWSASKHPSTDWSNFSATFNYDAPVTIDRSHMYEIVFHYHSDSGAFEWFATNYFTNVCTIWGRLSWTETASYGATPKASFNDYSSWSSQHQAPYIQLNSWSV